MRSLAPHVAYRAGNRGLPAPMFGAVAAGVADDPVEIPYSWLGRPLIRRPTAVVNSAEVSQEQLGQRTVVSDSASITKHGVGPASVTLHTAVEDDTFNLATHLVAYGATPRPRQPVVRLNLHARTDVECQRILAVRLAQRVRITDAPPTWPAGGVSFVVEGIRHVIGANVRTVDWSTSATIGTVPGTPGPWFRWDSSYWSGSDLRPF